MSMHTLRRRMSALGAVVGLGVVLPFTTVATPAFAQAHLTVTKTHEGNFARGGKEVYTITVTNTGNEATRRRPALPASRTTCRWDSHAQGCLSVCRAPASCAR